MPEGQYDPARLQELMDRRNVGDTALARKSGVTRTMIYYLRKGKRKTASAAVLARLAEALETTVGYLSGVDSEGEGRMSVSEPVRRLMEIANRLSELRQEELVRIATVFEQLEREQEVPSRSKRRQPRGGQP